MDCKEALEFVTPAVDGKLDASSLTQLEDHIKLCLSCRDEFELERMTKQLVHHRLPNLQIPAGLHQRISSLISQETSARKEGRFAFGNIFLRPVWKPALAALSVVAIVVFLLIPFEPQHSHARPIDGDIVNQTYNNFGKVLNGSFAPAITSDDPEELKTYFAKNADFKVQVPQLKRCKLMGAKYSNYNNENIAHLIYKHKQNIIYLYQTSLRAVTDRNSLRLPDDARDEVVQHRGWYYEKQCPKCTLVVWSVDSTICCAVSDMEKLQLLTFFRPNE